MPDHYKEPLKFIDIKDKAARQLRNATPASLAFFLGSEIPAVPADFDQRRLPFADIPMLLRAQRQHSLANPPQNNPFSIFGAERDLRMLKHRPAQ